MDLGRSMHYFQKSRDHRPPGGLINSLTPSYSLHNELSWSRSDIELYVIMLNWPLNVQANKPFGPRREKTCLRWFANNKGADQPAHPRSLISTFVFRVLESILFKRATSEISTFYLVSVTEENGLNLTLSETPKTGFLATRPI